MGISKFWLLAAGGTAALTGMVTVAAGDDADPRLGHAMAPQAIYDTDDRTLIGEAPAEAQELARSVVALVPTTDLQRVGDNYKVWGLTHGEDLGLCTGVAFSDIQSAADCSGVLIGPDLMLTAGHCVPDMVQCQAYNYVLGFEVTDRNPENVVSADQVYSCAGIAHAGGDVLDFTVVRLDRPVTDRPPIALETGPLNGGAPITMIGHPSGLPQVLTDNAQVLAVRPDAYLTNLDAFGGNSGSPVFSAAGRVAGILVSGQSDFEEIQAAGRRCTKPVYYRCDGPRCEGGGEVVVRSDRIGQVSGLLPPNQPVAERP
ncbi:MAG: trypsin-like peptidase domain-containing protein [Rhodospirillaceae bacterium]|nr:trypsin-like peptidase domain-containing protein [Rhodospirillaceae bacterium]